MSRQSCLNLRSDHRWCSHTSSTQATLPHYSISLDNRLWIRAMKTRILVVSATFTSMTSRGAGLPDPEAAVVPALASAFDSEVTSLEQVTARSTWVCASFRTAILSSSKRDFPLRKQKLGVTIPHGSSRFSTVSSDSYWQALLYLFRWAFHG